MRKKKKPVWIPKDSSDISLKTIIEIHERTTQLGQARHYMKIYGGQDPKEFTNESLLAVWATAVERIHQSKTKKAPKKIGEYHLPEDLTQIRVGAYIELCNLDLQKFDLLHLALGIFYRKDHSKDFTQEELVESANFFYESAKLDLAMQAPILAGDLVKKLIERYPILFPNINKRDKPNEKENERRAYDMLMTLTDSKFVDWKEAKQDILADAFVFLEEKRKIQIKRDMEAARQKAVSRSPRMR